MANNADACWSAEQMIENAGNWSLAGDAALLNNLKAFSERVLKETVQISNNVDNLINNLNNVSIKLDLAKNEFQSLRNSQFIESRVYEDDETIDNASSENKGEAADLTEDQKETVIKESICTGLKVMENYFDKVPITAATDDERGYILQLKDFYAQRPLPYLVGSQEWYMKWHVGLLKSDSEESEKEDETTKDKVLESSSEIGPSINQDEPQVNVVSDKTVDNNVNNTFNGPLTNLTFAEQLAQRLGSVIASDINKNPIQQNIENKYPRGLFSDEPPPLDATVVPQKELIYKDDNEQKELICRDDNEQTGQDISVASESLSADEVDKDNDNDLFRHPKLQPKGPFDEIDGSSDDDGDIFFKAERPKMVKPFLQPFKNTTPFLDEEPPELKPKKKVQAKKPVGGVSILGKDFQVPFQKVNRSSIISSQEKKKTSSLFDGSSEDEFVSALKPNTETTSFKDDNESKIQVKKKGDTDTNILKNSNFGKVEPTPTERRKKISLFDDDDFLEDEDDIFGNMGSRKNQFKDLKSDVGNKKHMLFDDLDELDEPSSFLSSSFQNRALFKDLEDSDNSPAKMPRKATIIKTKKNIGLFDSSEDENSDEDIMDKSVTGMTNKVEKNVSLFDSGEDEDICNKKIESTKIPTEDSTTIASEETSVRKDKPLLNELSTIEYEDSNKKDFPQKVQTVRGELEEIHGNEMKRQSKTNEATGLFSSDEDDSKDDEDVKDELNPTLNFLSTCEDEGNESVLPQKVETVKEDPEEKKGAFYTMVKSKAKQATGLFSSDEEDNNDFDKDEITKGELKPTVNLFSTTEDEHMLSVAKGQPEDDDSSVSQGVGDKTESNMHKKQTQHSLIEEEGENDFSNKYQEAEKSEKNSVKESIKIQDGKFNIFAALHDGIDVKGDENTIGEDLNTSNEDNSTNETHKFDLKPEIKVTLPTPNQSSKSAGNGTAKSRIINLFDPTPPPDDNFWDNSDDSDLEGFSINDDFNPESTAQFGSSLFDNEPPSMNANESSGIVRDQYATRIEPDNESFNPYASSSRKLSSDLFSDQQSQDSFFVTKNQTQSRPQLSSLPSIQDLSSKIADLTPSGQSEDFTEDEPSERNSVFEKSKEDSVVNTSKEEVKNIMVSDEDKSKILSPSKLKHNLKINVDALLPNASPPKLRGVVRSVSLDPGESPNASDTGILPNITKDRARILAKRRPSTRKGRQEAIRNSVGDFRLYHEEKSQEYKEEGIENKNENYSLQGSLDDDKKKGISLVFGSENIEKAEQKRGGEIADGKGRESKVDLFGEGDSSDEDLFGIGGATSTMKGAFPESEGLFGTKSSKKGNAKDSLFGDSEGSDDDDLFKTTKSISKDVFSSTPVEKRTVKTATVKKLENKEVTDDPLSLFQ